MKKLHLVGFTADSDLILSARKGAKTGSFVVPLDDALVSAIELARRRRDGELDTGEGGEAPAPSVAKPRSTLSPREIQARLRAGASVSEVATQAGADDEWVLRFAAPILAEQAKVIESAQRLTMAKTRRGPSIEPLAPSVQWNLSDRGVRMSGDVFADCWSAYNLHGARWAVRFSYTSRKRHQVAEWEVDLRERSLVARNRLAADLGHVEPGRRRPTAEELEAPAEPAAAAIATPAPTPAPPRPASPRGPAARAMTAAAVKVGKVPAKAASKPAAKAPARAAGKQAAKAAAEPAGGRGSRTASTAVAAKKAAPGRRQAAAKAPTPAKASAGTAKAATKRAPRQPVARKAAPARKKPGEAPGPPARAAKGRVAEPEPETEDRPSHLGRPPSPMKFANRATNLPLRRAPSSYDRQPPAPAPPPRRAEAPSPAPPPPRPTPAAAPEPANPANPRFQPGPEPDFTDPSIQAAAARGRVRTGAEVGRRPKATRSDGVETPRPAVVILSTPGAEPQPAAGVEEQERQARLASAERLRAALTEPPEPPPAAAPSSPEAEPARPRRTARRQALST